MSENGDREQPSKEDVRSVASPENRTAKEDDAGRITLVVFKLCEYLFAFRAEAVKEVLQPGKLNFFPWAPEFLSGMINVRGGVEPVVDLGGFLNLPSPGKWDGRCPGFVMLAEQAGVRTGLLVSSVEEVMGMPESVVRSPATGLANDRIRGFAAGEFDYEGGKVVLLDSRNLMLEIGAR